MEQAVFQRMLGEFNEVNERAVKLRDFILGDKFKDCLLYTSPSPRD